MQPAAAPRQIRAVLIGSVGNLVEWYDFYCYSAFSLYFANSFFPKQVAPPRCSRPRASSRWASSCAP